MPSQATLIAAGSPPLVGIARLAAHSPEVRERTGVTYFALPTRSVLNRPTSKPSKSGWAKRQMPFAWTVNPYRGCEFGCKYCYARYTHEFMEMRDGLSFERKIYAKVGSPELLRAELAEACDKGLPIALGAATDPYQPAEKQFQITRRILEAFARFQGVRFSITTKSVLILRDLDLLKTMRDSVGVHMSITTTSERLARLLEPKAPPPAKRFEAVARLVSEGIFAGVNAMPMLPGINDSPASIEHLARHAAAAGAKFMHGNTLFLMPASMRFFMPFLKQEFPHLVRRYQQLYARSAYLPEEYRKAVAARFAEVTERYGLNQTRLPPASPALGPAQMALRFDA